MSAPVKSALRLETLEPRADHLDGIRARFDVFLGHEWAGVLQLDDTGSWWLLTGPYPRSERRLLEERPARARSLGPVLHPGELVDAASSALWWAAKPGREAA